MHSSEMIYKTEFPRIPCSAAFKDVNVPSNTAGRQSQCIHVIKTWLISELQGKIIEGAITNADGGL